VASQRIRISIPKTYSEIWHDTISIAVLCVIILYIGLLWNSLPSQVPIHFNAEGDADGWGSRTILLLLPGVSLILYIAFSIVSRYPHRFNYPVVITAENVQEKYTLSRLLVSWLKLETILVLSYIEWSMLQTAVGENHGVSFWLLPVCIAVMLCTIGWCLFLMLRNSKKPLA